MKKNWDSMSNEELTVEYQRTNDNELFEYFIKRNERLILKYVGVIKSDKRHLDYQNLIQVCHLAMWKAMKTFDDEKGFKFSTHFHYCLRPELLNFYRNEVLDSTLPDYAFGQIEKLAKKYPYGMFYPISTDDFLNDENVIRVEDVLINDDKNIEDILEEKFIIKEVLYNINFLKPREQYIIRLRFGLGGETPHTLQSIADEIGLSRQRIEQIVDTSIEKLRKSYKRSDSIF